MRVAAWGRVQYRDPPESNDHPGTQTGPGSFIRSRAEMYRYDSDDRLIEQIVPERKTQWTLYAVGRRPSDQAAHHRTRSDQHQRNRTGKTETRTTVPPASAATVATTYRRTNAQDQLISVERSDGNSATADSSTPGNQTSVSYRYNTENLRT